MSRNIRLSKGLNISLKGEAEMVYANPVIAETFAVKPTDFSGLIPKLHVKQGDEVKAGSVLFSDKYNEKIKFTSPVSGEVAEVVRGDKRRILEVRILADKEIKYNDFGTVDTTGLTREVIVEKMLESGLWPMLLQRPLSTIANPELTPKSIFISAFDTNPLAADNDFIVHGNGEDFQNGLDIVAKLTDGTVHLNVNGESKASKVFTNSKNVQINYFSGPHPAGNVGVQIHHIDPVGKEDVVWTLTPQDVLSIGKFFKTGKYDASKIIALAGPSVKQPRYLRSISGACIKHMVEANIEEGDNRYISGNVLTGTTISADGYLGYYHTLITVLPEGKDPEFMGWILPTYPRPSLSRSFLSTWIRLLGAKKAFNVNTNMHGEERAFVMSGQYDKVLPMDIYPVQLLKAIMAGDIELMENLGIYEIAEEDLALCEFVCTSKIEVQQIVKEGLEIMRKELAG